MRWSTTVGLPRLSDGPVGFQRQAVSQCEDVARANHGVIPRIVAVDAGLTDAAIHRLVSSGRWQRVLPRAYVVAGAPLTWLSRLAAVRASLEHEFAFSHRTAGALLELDGVPKDHVEVVTRRSLQLPDVIVHRVSAVPRRTLHVSGFPITSAHRTILDLFAVLPPNLAERALDDGLRRKLTSIDRLASEYVECCNKGRNGCCRFRGALLTRDHRDGALQSRMEAKLRRIVRTLPGAVAVPQFKVDTGEGRFRIDFAYPDVKLGIEAQSIKWHLGEPRFYYDMKRDRKLKRVGWTLLYYSWDDLLRPADIRAEIIGMRNSMERVLF